MFQKNINNSLSKFNEVNDIKKHHMNTGLTISNELNNVSDKIRYRRKRYMKNIN